MQKKRERIFIFRPPAFLTMPATGIDISDRSIKFADVVCKGSVCRLGRFGRVSLEQGIVEGGRIMDADKLIAVLSDLRKKHNLSFIRAALPEEQMYFFRTRIPEKNPKAIREMLELSLEEHVPIPAMEAMFDFEAVREIENDTEVTVTAANQAVIEGYTDVFAAAGLTVLSLELEAKAIVRAIIRQDDMVARLIVDFGQTRTGIVITQGGRVLFTSTIAVGGRMITDTLAKEFNISPEEADTMKREYGLRRNTPRQELFALLLNNIAVLRDEINRHLIYWHTHEDEKGKMRAPVEEILLVGGDSNLAGLSDYLSTSLRIPTTLGDVWMNIPLPAHDVPQVTRNDSIEFATAIGLALRTNENE